MVVAPLTDEELAQLRNALRKILLAASPETVHFLDETFAEDGGGTPPPQ